MSEIKRKRMKKVLLCEYCYNFRYSKKRYATKISISKTTNDVVIHERICREGERVTSHDTACEKFRPATRFWCDRSDHWITPEVCLHRREIKKTGCPTCKQYKQAVSLYIKKAKKETENGRNN